jgi:hypothetical protein
MTGECKRTPQQIIDEFAGEAKSILSGTKARLEVRSKFGGEVGEKFRWRDIVTRGRGHSVFTARDGRVS